ncbi:MAG: phosphate acetyltransferase [Candidatus Omnitrophota bacterium]
MDAVRALREKAKKDPKVIILPEKEDVRMQEAVKIIEQEQIAKVVFLGRNDLDEKKVKAFSDEYFNMRQYKGITYEEAEKIIRNPLFYAAMMVRHKQADGFVAGAANTTSDVARAAIHCLEPDPTINTVSSVFIMVVPNCQFGEDGLFIFADCGIIPDPTARQLAYIAITTAELAQKVLEILPKVAMLSYSTKGSAQGRFVEEIRNAVKLVKEIKPDLCVDGELQVDSAIVPEVSKIKDPDSKLAGRANILIFPNLEAGNIGYKLVERLAKARAIGPILLGLNYPCSDLSRGCSVEDIVDCTAVTVIRAQK